MNPSKLRLHLRSIYRTIAPGLLAAIAAIGLLAINVSPASAEDSAIASSGICDRTAGVQAAILAEIQAIRDGAACSDVTNEELAAIDGELQIAASDVALGDFDGLSGVTELELSDGTLSVLREDAFRGLNKLETLKIDDDTLTTLHGGAFNGLDALTRIDLRADRLRALPTEAFQGLDGLTFLEDPRR